MKKLLLNLSIVTLLLNGCASHTFHSDQCVTYTISGASVDWKPTNFYQEESSLYIEIPPTVDYVPTLEVIDPEFDQRYKVHYSYDENTHQFKVKDNYDEYILERKDADEITTDRVYIKCNRDYKV